MNTKNKNIIKDILQATPLLSMASITKDGKSWICTAFYAYDDKLKLYFLTPPTTQHSKNLEKNASVAISVFDTHQNPDDKKRGLQIFGACHKAAGNEIEKGLRIYGKRFVDFGKKILSPEDIEKSKMHSRFYVVVPQKIKIFDELVFGEEIWVTVVI
ncbi:hypothetical protein A2875_02990 [Candidatus Gottesmanbacteria bacterium RIFCSPHIGHO2_01_FULL_46_14]|uniref:Pyridoxamine 5'-phosphate oxidase N-terminal domain-containing protein n=2 Tax=Candidatus Gottesmaniibacteriota TaxID=1752720 RepID=A0A1F5ZR60_9BACT|nr:MAG: hypothetical protein A2875_02990 [Candidatus Gottesmanbacteria bacterium RIFCSPHIGHO2_01_FULL_46_14]OGG30323.1 MAG: hypothetical protein A2971_01880 [Candidatus Gottesmanbacteria bacterium RIFCSPLOWO2_01_FULL_46_21]